MSGVTKTLVRGFSKLRLGWYRLPSGVRLLAAMFDRLPDSDRALRPIDQCRVVLYGSIR